MRQSSQAVTSSLVAAVMSASAAIPASAGVVTVVPNLASADDSGRFIQYIEEYSPATVRYCLAEGLASRYGSAVASSLDRTLQRLTVAASQPDISPNGCSPFSHEVVVNTYSVGVDAPSAAVLVDPEPTEPVSVFGASVAVLADGGRMPGAVAARDPCAVDAVPDLPAAECEVYWAVDVVLARPQSKFSRLYAGGSDAECRGVAQRD